VSLLGLNGSSKPKRSAGSPNQNVNISMVLLVAEILTLKAVDVARTTGIIHARGAEIMEGTKEAWIGLLRILLM
jgi:hypothetical protein